MHDYKLILRANWAICVINQSGFIQIISNLHVIQRKRNILLTKGLIDFILLPKFCIPSSNQHTLTQSLLNFEKIFFLLIPAIYTYLFTSVVFVLWMRSSKNLIIIHVLMFKDITVLGYISIL